MALITNKDLIQSYIVTTARYDFSVYEKRILYRIIEMLQYLIEGKRLNEKYNMEENLWGDKKITMPISCFLTENDKNYKRIKDALTSLRNKTFEYEDEKTWELLGIIEKPVTNKYEGFVSFELTPRIYEAFLNFAKGYRKYELKVAMQFKSIYAMRMYELISGKTDKIEYELKTIRDMFRLTNKYKAIKDLRQRVFDVAQKELDEKSPYTFTYKLENRRAGKTYTHITFYPVYQPQFRDTELADKEMIGKHVSNRVAATMLPHQVVDFLKNNFEFTDKEIHSQLLHIDSYIKSKGAAAVNFLSQKKEWILAQKSSNKPISNPKGYIISVIQKEGEKTAKKDEKGKKNKTYSPEELAAALGKSNIGK